MWLENNAVNAEDTVEYSIPHISVAYTRIEDNLNLRLHVVTP